MEKTETQPTAENPHTKKGGHRKHFFMMATCCGLPILAVLALPAIGIASTDFEYLIYLACPLGMGAMMFMMHRKDDHKAKDAKHAPVTEPIQQQLEGGASDGYSNYKELKSKQDEEEHQNRKNGNHSCCHF